MKTFTSVEQTVEVPAASRTNSIPTNISGLLSDTNSAGECFVNQRFSGRLQAFLVGYVGNIVSNRSVYEA